jgi:purine-binding chemotaxis protein CheW
MSSENTKLINHQLEHTDESGIDDRYLVFRLGKELYATPLLRVREVVEPFDPKPIPNTPKFFSGVVDIRGEVVGVVDLRLRFGHGNEKQSTQALMVFSTDSGPMAALVDQVVSVITLTDKEIESRGNLGNLQNADSIIGIGKKDKKLITLIDLLHILESYGSVAKSGAQKAAA